jgi:hypothetical protein
MEEDARARKDKIQSSGSWRGDFKGFCSTTETLKKSYPWVLSSPVLLQKEAKNSKVPKLTVVPCVHPHTPPEGGRSRSCRHCVLCFSSVRRSGYRLHGGFTLHTHRECLPLLDPVGVGVVDIFWALKNLSILTLSPLSKTPRARSPTPILHFYWPHSSGRKAHGGYATFCGTRDGQAIGDTAWLEADF